MSNNTTTTTPTTNVIEGFLGIDNGTQGLSVLFTDAENLHVLATADANYDFVPNLPEGCYEQRTTDWDQALSTAMKQLQQKLQQRQQQEQKNVVTSWKILAIGISGQMHGEVLVGGSAGGGDDDVVDASTTTPKQALAPVRLWCDARNTETGDELTTLFQTKVPKRATCARFLWTIRTRPDLAIRTKHITTPAGWCAYRLTGEWNLGIGDASGMFPMNDTTRNYDTTKLQAFDQLSGAANNSSSDDAGIKIPSLADLLPAVKCAGEDAGSLTREGAALLGLGEDAVGIPVAGAEGDQVAALAGSLIGRAGTISCCFGTYVLGGSLYCYCN